MDKISIKKSEVGQRLDVFLAGKIGLTRSKIQKMIKFGQVLINDEKPQKAGQKLPAEGVIEILDSVDKINSENINNKEVKKLSDFNIEVIADEKDYLVVNKPGGLLVHPTEANELVTLTAWLLKNYKEIEGVGDSDVRPGLVHRLDKAASGLLVVAKNQKMFEYLKNQFKERTVEKEYRVLVFGLIESDFGEIDFDIDRGPDGRMVSRPKTDRLKLKNVTKIQDGKSALTEFSVKERFPRHTLLKVKIHSGRTHQIRVHMLAYNHPVVGDRLYFNKNLFRKSDILLDRLFLHAKKLCFDNLSGEKICFEIDLPDELKNYIDELK
jgi:23S rRNA pseudouridine1911/1915/1917 synthase